MTSTSYWASRESVRVAVGRSEKGGIREYPWSVQITIRATRSERRSGKKNAVKICDWNGNTNNYKHNSKGKRCREIGDGDGDGDWGVCRGAKVLWLSGSGW